MQSGTLGKLAFEEIRGEFLQTPGLRLKPHEVQRLWNLDADQCRTVLERLLEVRFLSRGPDGTFMRNDD
jgi:hypothetical protein